VDSADLQVLDAALDWLADGRRVALATVARTWGSSPRPPGSWLALRDDGRVVGSVSGGCVEGDLMERMGAGRLEAPNPFLLSYGVTADEAARFGLPCGGRLDLVVEPAPQIEMLHQLRQGIRAGCTLARTIGLDGSEIRLQPAEPGAAVRFDGERLMAVHGPRLRLFVVGAGQIGRYLAEMAQALDYEVAVCDPREEYARHWAVPGARLLEGMPDDAVLSWRPDPRSAVVALTHDPKLDDLVLLEALRTPAFYIGALGSRANQAQRRKRLAEHFAMGESQLSRLHGPVGLPIGSRTPPEIAVAILAAMTAAKNGVSLPLWHDAHGNRRSE
jgi:Xanthine and CO dehydrogenases maturation factor, XdhC/CoxF family